MTSRRLLGDSILKRLARRNLAHGEECLFELDEFINTTPFSMIYLPDRLLWFDAKAISWHRVKTGIIYTHGPLMFHRCGSIRRQTMLL